MLFVALQELELNFNRLSEINLQLRKEKAEAAAQLGARSAERAALEAELAKLKVDAGKLEVTFKDKLVSRGLWSLCGLHTPASFLKSFS